MMLGYSIMAAQTSREDRLPPFRRMREVEKKRVQREAEQREFRDAIAQELLDALGPDPIENRRIAISVPLGLALRIITALKG